MAIGAILLARPSLARKSLQDGGEEIYRNGTEGSNPACSSGESANHLFLSDGAKSAEAPYSPHRDDRNAEQGGGLPL